MIGADAIFLLTSGDFAAAGGDLDAVLEVARAGGVRRVVLLSSQGFGTRHHSPEFEDAVTRSGLEWAMLRPENFASNALQWAEMVRAQRTVAAPFGDVGLSAIDPVDIAEAAAVALRDTRHAGRIYELTRPAPMTTRQQVAAIGEALGEPVRFVEQSRAEAKTQLTRFMPEPIVDRTLDILGSPGALQRVSPDVERLLGRPARTFAEWVARNIAAFE
ncbi:NmrA family transcriptional regulator [Saccharopolyspora hattusasensis]|uniref:NmrA family transcriptional regulator n=1 Tax=Saccharopolyspora hattusasensis TaxID=1128679 RepID=UPI003D95B0D7